MMDIFKAVDKVGEITEFCKTRNIWDILDRLDISYDDDIIELIRNGYTRNAAASQLMVQIPFLDYKIRILREYDTPLNYVDLPDTFCLGEDITDSREQW